MIFRTDIPVKCTQYYSSQSFCRILKNDRISKNDNTSYHNFIDRFFLSNPGQRKNLSKKETPHHSARSGSFLEVSKKQAKSQRTILNSKFPQSYLRKIRFQL